MKNFAFVLSAAAVFAVAPLSAQSWTTFTPNLDGVEFWDNLSDDGRSCNVGFVLTNAATGDCANQRPAGWLPYTGTSMDQFWGGGATAPNLLFGAGTFTFSLLPGTTSAGGDVAGQNRDWGYYDYATATFVNLNTGLPGSAVTFTGNWSLWVSLTNGSVANSASTSQFAAFRSTAQPGYYVFGVEDIYTGQGGGSDRDFNDMFFAITESPDTPLEVVPEPATMTLLATGLAGMAAARRRRKNQS